MYAKGDPQNNHSKILKGAIYMMQEKISSYSENPDCAIYGAVMQARDAGIKNPIYTTEQGDFDGTLINVEGYQTCVPWTLKYYLNPCIDDITITSHEGVIIELSYCTLAIKGYPIYDENTNAVKEWRYIVKLLSEQVEGMKPIQLNIKADELESVINEYWAIQQLENDLKHLNDKENYTEIQFEDEYTTRYYLVHKAKFNQTVKEFKAKQEGVG